MTHIIKSRPRLLISVLVMILTGSLLPAHTAWTTRLLLAWNSGIGLYLILILWMMKHSTMAKLRKRAAEDEGKIAILILTIVTVTTSLAAIVAELASAKSLTGFLKGEHIALAALTVVFSWCFMQMIFALHYAHEFHAGSKGAKNGLEFPGTPDPDYWDFVYFSFIIGTAAQTADVNITSQKIRRLATLHCIIIFFFNVMILALMINMGAGLL